MNRERIAQNIRVGIYDTELPYPNFYDEKEGKISKEQSREMKTAWRVDVDSKKQRFKRDCRKWAETNLDRKITDEQFDSLFSWAWDDGHSSGYEEISQYFEDLLDLVILFLGDR